MRENVLHNIYHYLPSVLKARAPATGGTPQYAVHLDGIDGRVACGSDASLDDIPSAGDFTAEAWARVDSVSTGVIISKHGGAVGWMLEFFAGVNIKAQVQFDTTDNNRTTTGNPITVGRWHHIAMVYDSASKDSAIYVDGTLEADSGNAGVGTYGSDNAKFLQLGARSDTFDNLDGAIAWARISSGKRYTANFTPDTKDAPPAVDGDTIEQWNLNEGSGSTTAAQVNTPTNDGTIVDGGWAVFTPVTYLLRDEFTTPDAAPITSPRTCEPGPGTLTFTDTGSKFSISGGELNHAGTTESWAIGSAQTRAAGLLAYVKMQRSDVNDGGPIFTWNTSSTGNPNTIGNREHAIYIDATASPFDVSAVNPNSPSAPYAEITGYLAANTYVGASLILRSAGAFVIADDKLLWVDNAASTATLYPAFRSKGAVYTSKFDSLRVAQLPTPWDTDDGIATDTIASPSAGNTFAHDADFILEFMVDTMPTPSVINIEVRKQDTNNNWVFQVNSAGKLALFERIAGTYYSRAESDISTVNTNDRCIGIFDGTTITGYVNNTQIWQYTSATNFQMETSGNILGLGSGAISALKTWPRTLSGAALTALTDYTT